MLKTFFSVAVSVPALVSPAIAGGPLLTQSAPGAASQSIPAKLAALETSGADFNVRCDGNPATDDGPAINNALAAASFAAGHNSTVRLAGPVCSIKTTLTAASWSGIHLTGNALGDFGRSTIVRWTGAPGSTMADLTSSNAYQNITTGLDIRDIEWDANRLAGECLKIRTLTASTIHAQCDNPTSIGFDIDVANLDGSNPYPSTVGDDFWLKVQGTPDATGTGTLASGSTTVSGYTGNAPQVGWYVLGQGIRPNTTVTSVGSGTLQISNPPWYVPAAGSQLIFYQYQATGIVIGRGAGISHATADVNSNHFHTIIVSGLAGDGVVCGAADGNIFDYIEDTGDAPGSGTTGPIPGAHVSLRLQGSGVAALQPYTTVGSSAASPEACRYNMFHVIGVTGRVTVENGMLRTNGTGTGYAATSAAASGATSVPIGGGSGTVTVGDTVSFAGVSGSYVVLAVMQGGNAVASSSAPTGVVLASGLSAGLASGAAMTIVPTTQNVYPSQLNIIHDLSTLDSFSYLDAANASPASGGTSRQRGDGTTAGNNQITTEGGNLSGYASVSAGAGAFGSLSTSGAASLGSLIVRGPLEFPALTSTPARPGAGSGGYFYVARRGATCQLSVETSAGAVSAIGASYACP